MNQGKYQAPRRRRRRINWTGVFFWLVVLAIIVAGIVLLCRSCDRPEDEPDGTNDTSLSDTQAPQTSQTPSTTTLPVTTTSVESTTEVTTVPTTEATTVPTTEATTAPTTEPEEEPSDSDNTLGDRIAAVAKSVLGKPYAQGGDTPEGFDTSGLVSYCYSECGISVPRRISTQFESGTAISQDDLQPGDVVFFSLENAGEAEYVGIYIGNNTFIAVSSSKNAVEERDMGSGYFAERYVGARRYQ